MTTSRAVGDGVVDDGAAVVPLALLDDLLASVAGVLHDRPVQSLVAARLLLETGLSDSQRGEMLDRGLGAITSAGEQARDIMWALGGTSVRPSHVAADVGDAVARLGAPGAGVDLSVQVADDVDARLLAVVVQAVHEVLVGLMMSGGHLDRLRLVSDAESLQVVLVGEPGPRGGPHSPWLRLAGARLDQVDGQLTHRRNGSFQTTEITVPLDPLLTERSGPAGAR